MRIHDTYTKLDRAAGATSAAKSRGVGPDAKATGSADASELGAHGVEVSVSARARELAASSETSNAKVSALRERLQRGELTVDARAIAAKLVGSDLP